MAYIGKINLAELAPNHPFAGRCILFVPEPPVVSKEASQSSKKVVGSSSILGHDRPSTVDTK
jgi:hypothetical protein